MAREHDLPLIYVVLNNSTMGNVRDFFSRKGRPLMDKPETNFAAIAMAMGIQGIRVEGVNQIKPAIEKALNMDGPVLIDIITSKGSHLRLRSSI
jgi:thiamine pyrophosphate-dependent acetolactate synthase large subunit-like protein